VKKLLLRVIVGVAVGVAIYVAFSVWADARSVGRALADFRWTLALLGLGLALLNYAVRFFRWQYYLHLLEIKVPWTHSLLVFLSGFSLTVTPGKLGEMVKALLLRESHAVPAARTAPIVIAERFTDLVGLLLLACVGVFSFAVDHRFLIMGTLLILAGLVVISVEPIALFFIRLLGHLPIIGKFSPKLRDAYHITTLLLGPRALIFGILLSTISWAFECVAFWIIVHGFVGASINLQAATFIYATMTVAGALSFLPGGLGVTEAGMLGLLGELGQGTGRSVATAATFITRLVTLWFAVVLGLLALLVFARSTRIHVELPEKKPTA
jgi:uncharacterized membrane protein YbhN (UPF0104 family)